MEYLITVIVSASAWVLGMLIGRLIIKTFFEKETENVISSTDDDLLEFDQTERPFIPVRVLKENGFYYAWFSVNDKFIGQSKNLDEIRLLSHESVLKQIGLRVELNQESVKKAKAKA